RAIARYNSPGDGSAPRQHLTLANNVVACASGALGGLDVYDVDPNSPPINVRLTRNTFVGPIAGAFVWTASSANRRTQPAPELYRFNCPENVFATGLLFHVTASGNPAEVAQEQNKIHTPADARRKFRDLLSWQERRNVYHSATDFYGLHGLNNLCIKSEM